MAIQRVGKGTQFKAGMWVCFQSILIHGVCSNPVQITRDTKPGRNRVWYNSTKKEGELYKNASSAVFVCDTEAEGWQLHNMSEARREAVKAAIARVEADHDEKINQLIERVNAAA